MSKLASEQSLGVVLSTVTESSLDDLISLSKHAEAAGISTVYVNEGRGDAIASATAIALETKTVGVGTNIANIYFRHSYLAANSVRLLSEASEGRARVGFGISHKQLLKIIGIDRNNARAYLKKYVGEVKKSLEGKLDKGTLTPGPSKYNTPIFVAANSLETAAIAGSVGDGIMPYLTPLSSIPELLESANKTFVTRNEKSTSFDCVLSIPTFMCDDEEEARSAAKYNLAFFANLPNYRRQWRRSGFTKSMDKIKIKYLTGCSRREIVPLIPDELVDQVCIFGPVADCRKQIDAFRSHGVSEPVLAVSPVSKKRNEATIEAINELAQD